MTSGGKREGSGRPKGSGEGKKIYSFRVSDKEKSAVKALLKIMRRLKKWQKSQKK